MRNWHHCLPKSTIGGAAFMFVFGFLLIFTMDRLFWPHRDWWRAFFGAGGGTIGYLLAKRYLARQKDGPEVQGK